MSTCDCPTLLVRGPADVHCILLWPDLDVEYSPLKTSKSDSRSGSKRLAMAFPTHPCGFVNRSKGIDGAEVSKAG